MAYAIMRINKCKLGAVSRIEKHHERKKDVYKSNPDIDVSKTHKNFHIKDPPDSYRRLIKKRIEEVGCRTRKDSVVLQDSICTASPEFFKGKTSRETEDFFRTAYRFYCKTFGADNIISAGQRIRHDGNHGHDVYGATADCKYEFESYGRNGCRISSRHLELQSMRKAGKYGTVLSRMRSQKARRMEVPHVRSLQHRQILYGVRLSRT